MTESADEKREAKWQQLRVAAHNVYIEVHHNGRADVTEHPLSVIGLAFGFLHPRAQLHFKDGHILMTVALNEEEETHDE